MSADGVPHRGMITACAIGATLLQSLDQTIANVALPYMQGSFSASYTEITWVLTSYIVAAAIMTAPVGWLAVRFGRKPLYVGSIIGFTIASMLCGAAQSIEQIVLFRLLQGMFSAALVPLSQATLLDIYPPERRGFAMAIWGVGVMIGPIMGPTLGGYLTEFYNWRFVFYINLPFGLLATFGLITFLPKTLPQTALRFDWFGFAVLTTAIGAFQLMLDRGQDQDWFGSTEIIVEAVAAGLGLYLFLVHMSAARAPLIRPAIFRDVNFSSGLVLMFAMGTLLVSSLALMAPWLQNLANYPVETAGLVMAPRGFGNLITITLAGKLTGRMDPRWLVAAGLLLICWSFWRMTGWTPDVDRREIILAIVIQGAGMGLVFTPLQVLAFATLPTSFRTEAASLFSLLRNIGAAIGVSVTSTMLTRHAQALHEEIGAAINPFNRALQALSGTGRTLWDPGTADGIARLDQVVTHQAQVIAYMNDYVLLICTTLPALLLLLLMRQPRRAPVPVDQHAAMD
ncbi:MAG: EmrB/QacA family drug resistance transporter [Rhodospirillales bacterium 69-11]|nr:DHA2 family efflux MFS transporter permease subunit [Rhodospirillales bacterium]MBN8929139.1 DHA2 family efflux MFS transporter permease subunit [Rhodospirillales bacterium]OJW23380.1 MAG: EmrB/QacA family drug resistance transporter [Rhodospirillales bacterium 69-11]